jgi:hypothetical protein
MTTIDPYEQWQTSRRAQQPPGSLADRIMAAIEAAPAPAPSDERSAVARRSQRRQAALIAVAASAFLLRVAAAFAVFLTS